MQKRISLLKMFVMGLLSCTYMLLGAQTIQNYMLPKSIAPSIDGNIDNIWNKVDSQLINKALTKTGITNSADNSAWFKVLWDSTYCYLLVSVQDDSIYNLNATPWFNDNLEIYFDMNNSKNKLIPPTSSSSAYDTDDYQLRIVAGSNIEYFSDKMKFAQTVKNGQYIIEAKIEWKALTSAKIGDGSIIGFDLIVADNDGTVVLPDANGTGRDGITSWNSATNEAWHNPSLFGTMKLQTIEVPKSVNINAVNTIPVIDADIDSIWNTINSEPVNKIIASSASGITDNNDFSCSYKATWDNENFYILFEVKDETLYDGNADSYLNDNVEIYFDLDNSKNSMIPRNAAWNINSFDNNDAQVRLNWGTKYPTELRLGRNSGNPSLITYSQKNVSGGYVMEAKIPWYALGYIGIQRPATIGFDVLFSDNDGDGRNQITWNTTTEPIWHDASLMGNMNLTGTPVKNSIFTIDGQPDNVWNIAKTDVIAKKISVANVTDSTDFSAKVKTLWDANNFYLYIVVNDDSIVTLMPNDWDNDNLEVYFDLNNSKNDTAKGFDEFDKSARLFVGKSEFNGIQNINYSYKRIGKQYVMEAAIPWKSMKSDFVPQSGMVIGFDLVLSDNDDGKNRDALGWNTQTWDTWRNPSIWGDLKLYASGVAERLITRPAGNVNYFVSASLGNDANNGLSPEYPYKSIQKAANQTLPGDTVNIMNGTYEAKNTVALTVTTSGTAAKWITFRALKGHKPKIKISGVVWQTIVIEANYIIIEGIEIEGDVDNLNLADAQAAEDEAQKFIEAGVTFDYNKYAKFNTTGIVLGGNNSSGNHHMVIRACKVHDVPSSGIGSTHAEYLTVEDCIIYNTNNYTMWPSSAISFYHLTNLDTVTSYKNFIRRNICYNNKALVKWITTGGLSDGNGIIIDDSRNEQPGGMNGAYNGRTLIENNICYNNGGSGIHAFNSNHVDIINNTAYNNGYIVDYNEIFAVWCTDVKIMNNIMYGRDGSKINSSDKNVKVIYDYNVYFNGKPTVKGAHDIVADPMFVNLSTDPAKADFRLQDGSPAVDHGTSDIFSKHDILGIKRPLGKGIDAGAYESSYSSNNVTQVGNAEFSVWPNPVSSKLQVSCESASSLYRVEIFNQQGQLIQNLNNLTGKSVLNVSNLNQGMYFINIKSKNSVEQKKFVKL